MELALPGYSLTGTIYESPQTVVYRAVREQDGMPVAIKTLRGDYPSRQDIARFCHEYQIRRKLAGAPGVAQVYALENASNRPALVQEFISGSNLSALRLDRQENFLERFFTLAMQIAAAVGDIHRQYIIHKDINPHNILWHEETGTIKIVDFDIASELSRERQSQSAALIRGSLPYISPEQTGRMNRAIDYRSDLYSMGATFYRLLSGELPFEVDDNDPGGWIHCHIAKEPKALCCPDPALAPALAAIIAKLMAKNAEDRYQSAFGVINDLDYCRQRWLETGAVTDFIPGRNDFSDRFEIPQKLYGRKDEVADLMRAFAAIGEGASKMFLVSGYSGIGKSALINEVHKPIAAGNGYFIEGKFDQFQQNIPYFAIAQAFGRLIRQLLVEPPESLQHRQAELLAALGPNGQVLIDIIPELEQIIGPQPPVPHLGTEENQNRFNQLFQQFLQLFTQQAQPLVLFIDDLQWVDSASLNLIKQFMLNPQHKQFLFIGAYRDNEVDDHHPFIAAVRELKKAGVEVSDLILKPLALEHVNQLLVDTVRADHQETLPLAELAVQKTGGNPFFINQFLRNCHETGLLTFEADTRRWLWDLQQIARQNSSDNVVDLMVSKMARLPQETRELLRLGACIGNVFYLQTLAIISEKSQVMTARELWPAVDAGLLLADGDGHALLKCLEETDTQDGDEFPAVANRFLHDRVQQAAYSLIDADQKQQVHLKIARLLLRETPADELENCFFDIVEHYNKSAALLDSNAELRLLAELNLKAGQKAKDATAYGPALQYFSQGANCCRHSDAEEDYRLLFDLEKGQVECHFLLSEVAEGIAKADALLKKCRAIDEKVAVNNILILYYGGAGEMDRAIDIALDSLRYFGVDLPRNPNKLQLLAELLEAKLRLGRKSAAQLQALPLFQDQNIHSVFSLLKELIAPTYLQGLTNLLPYIILRMFNLTLKHGNGPVASFAYSGYALLWAKLDDFAEAHRFGVLALDYNKYVNNPPMEARCYFMATSFALYWRQAFRDSQALRRTGLQKLIDTGEYFWASYIYLFGFWQEVLLSDSLEELFELTEREIQFAKKAKQAEPFHVHTLHRNLFKILAGEGLNDTALDFEAGDEAAALAYFERNVTSTMGKFYHVVCRLLLHFYREEHEDALHYATRADMTEEVIRDGTFTRVMYTFFSCLSILSSDSGYARFQNLYRQRKRKLQQWYRLFPENFAALWFLLQAEENARTGRDIAAIGDYEQAIRAAQENASLFLESLANELYAKFWLRRDKQKIAAVYMTDAAYLYYRWGATGKQEQLQNTYKASFNHSTGGKSTITLKTTTVVDRPNEETSLDLHTLAKASQLLAGEISMDKLLRNLMHFLIESAGAQKGILILQEDERLFVAASCCAEQGQEIITQQKIPLEGCDLLSPAIVRYVARSTETLVLGNAAEDPGFAQDAYIHAHRIKSVMCFPLMQDRNKLKGILYLENNLANDTFNPSRVEVLNVLSGEIAVALENARLYRNLEEYNQTLEEKVAERTRDLHAMNEALLAKNTEIRDSKQIIEDRNENITRSLMYAQKIQQALLPQQEKIAAALPDFFVIFKPKQIVSGDFYWFNQIDGKIFLAVADCTGHGVPGAFLSMIGHMLLNKIVNEQRIFEPARILEALHEEVRSALNQEGQTRQGYDGMDIAFCRLELEQRRLLFAGAKRPLYLVTNRDNQTNVIKIRGDRKSIGGRQKEQQRQFTNHELQFELGDALYLLSDGLIDQNNASNERLGSLALETLLRETANHTLVQHKVLIEEELCKHQGEEMQRDDITIIGVKF